MPKAILTNFNFRKQKGFSLIELIVALAFFVLVVSGVIFLVLDAHSANRQGQERNKATQIAQEGLEAARSMRNRAWKYLAVGTHGISDSQGYWDFNGTTDAIDQFTRQTTVGYVQRDAVGNIVPSGGTTDYDTKKVSTNVTWDFTPLRPSRVTLETYLTNWRSNSWKQTSFADFNSGVRINTVVTNVAGGEVQLATTSSPQTSASTFDTPADYTYDPAKIEVTGGQARLKQLVGTVSGDTINPGFDTNANGWTYIDWDQNKNEVDVNGTWRSTGGNPNPGGWVDINIPRGNRDQVGGFWQQSFTTTASNPTAQLTFDWRVTGFNGFPMEFTMLAFVDSTPGAPARGSEVWFEEPFSVTQWTATPVTIDVSSKVATPGTYYLKLAVWVVTGTTNVGAFTIGYDNAKVHWSGQAPGGYATDRPTITPKANASFTGAILAWQGFVETATKNGGEIYYQLSDDDGITWRYWNGTTWATASSSTNYNTATVVNTNIGAFPLTNQKIRFKAFLSSNGNQLVILDEVRITALVANGFATSGTFQSSAFSTGSTTTVYNYIAWTADILSGTTVKFQTRTSDSPWLISTAPWVGPDGTASTYYTNPGDTIVTTGGTRYIQYKIFYTSPGASTPVVKDVTVNYEI